MRNEHLARASLVAASLLLLGTGCFKPGRGHSKEYEARSNLKSLYTAERALMQERDKFSNDFVELGFFPERGNRYAYFLGSGARQDRTTSAFSSAGAFESIGVDVFKHGKKHPEIVFPMLPKTFAGNVRIGVTGECPNCQFVAAAAANLDSDATLDVWSIASFERVAPDGTTIPAGLPFWEIRDVEPPSMWQEIRGIF